MQDLPKLISKTKLLRGYQCSKSLYFSIHCKDLEPPVTPELRALFDQGTQVGIFARQRFTEGVLIDGAPWDFGGALARTRQALQNGVDCLFEPAFEYKSCFARADILKYSPRSERWTLIEVKAATRLKPEHLQDLALQTWILANAGVALEKICLWHINGDCEFPNLDNLFTELDLTSQMRDLFLSIAPKLNSLFSDLRQDSPPQISFGRHCLHPNACPFLATCKQEAHLPSPSVFDLPGLWEQKWALLEKNQLGLQSTETLELSEHQKSVIQCHLTQAPLIDKKLIQEKLSSWKMPLSFLDFESINPAIPRFSKTRPYQQVPFQFSIQTLTFDQEEPHLVDFLHSDSSDPRPELITRLLQALPHSGSIVAYYSKFEKDRITELADFSPKHRDQLLALLPRFVDPLDVIREAVYFPQFKDSYSLKVVAPVLLGDAASYHSLEIGDGLAAQRAFERLLLLPADSPEKESLKNQMLQYCNKDTLVLLQLTQWLFSQR